MQRDTSLSTFFRIFTVDAGETVSISSLTIAQGDVGLSNGGGSTGTLTVGDSTFTGKYRRR